MNEALRVALRLKDGKFFWTWAGATRKAFFISSEGAMPRDMICVRCGRKFTPRLRVINLCPDCVRAEAGNALTDTETRFHTWRLQQAEEREGRAEAQDE